MEGGLSTTGQLVVGGVAVFDSVLGLILRHYADVRFTKVERRYKCRIFAHVYDRAIYTAA